MKSVFADAVVIGGKTKSKLEKGKGFCASPSILKTREHNISKTGSVSVFR
jgi:hypothetical protein